MLYLCGGAESLLPSVFHRDMSGCGLDGGCVQLQLVQSYVLSSGYPRPAFFTEQTLEVIRSAIADAGVFVVTAGFSLWKDLCDPDVDEYTDFYCRMAF